MDPFEPHLLLRNPHTIEYPPQSSYVLSMICILSILIVYGWLICIIKHRFQEVHIH